MLHASTATDDADSMPVRSAVPTDVLGVPDSVVYASKVGDAGCEDCTVSCVAASAVSAVGVGSETPFSSLVCVVGASGAGDHGILYCRKVIVRAVTLPRVVLVLVLVYQVVRS